MESIENQKDIRERNAIVTFSDIYFNKYDKRDFFLRQTGWNVHPYSDAYMHITTDTRRSQI